MNVLIYVLMFCTMCGCLGTSAKLNNISLGMTKTEVINAIGSPDSVSAEGNVEYLTYHWASPKQIFANENNLGRYYIRIYRGKVDSYGKKGDFNSTKTPTTNLNINMNK